MKLDFNFKKLKLPNKKSIEEQLIEEANKLKDMIQVEIDKWYSSYSPIIYKRSYQMKKTLYVDDIVKVGGSGNQLTVSIKYNDNAFYKSMWENKFINMLYVSNYGYRVKSGWHKNIPYFGYRLPTNYIENAINEFNKDNYLGLSARMARQESVYR